MTTTPLLDSLDRIQSTDVTWHEDERPVLVADGVVRRIRDLDAVVNTARAHVVGINQHDLERLAGHLRTSELRIYEMRVPDLAPLASIGPLSRLAIEWNTKATSLETLGQLVTLEILSLVDIPKARDLTPIARLTRLRAFEFSGGIWTKNTALSLAPLAQVDTLEELRLTNLRVLDGGLRPLAGCRSLRRLDVSNQFQTADYAYLSVALPSTACDHFAPYVSLASPIGAKDVMVVGARKPFLHATTEARRLATYVDAFRRLQDDAADELARSPSRLG